MIRPALLALTAAVALTGCGQPAPPPEASICARTADNVRVDNTACGPGSTEFITGQVRWLAADPECLDADDHTPVGAVADDDYLEGCDEDGKTVVKRKKTTTTTAKKAPATTTKKRA